MKNIAFTICTKSYVGLATILQTSLQKYNSDFDFYIFIADEVDDELPVPRNSYVVKNLNIISEKKWIECAFKYNVTEFCTCLKPFVFRWIINNLDVENVFYMDPDLYFFSDAKPLSDGLKDSLIELTPHFLTFPQTQHSKYFEDEIRYSGIFNLGFLGVKKHQKVLAMLDWWGDNLLDKAFCDPATFQFTDQKWMDFMPLFFETNEINIIRNFGWNIAPWNYFERKVTINNGKPFVENRNESSEKEEIVFAHFSGFNYKKLTENEIIQVNNGHENEYDDANDLLKLYIDELINKKNILLPNLSRKYNYNFYSNGKKIEKLHRRLFRSYLINNFEVTKNPFSINEDFFKCISKQKMFSKESENIEILKDDETYVHHKLGKMNILFKFVFKILGYQKYSTMLRFLHRYTKSENQLFLLDMKKITWE